MFRDKFPTPLLWDTDEQVQVWLFICQSDFDVTLPAWIDATAGVEGPAYTRESYIESVATEAREYFDTTLDEVAIAQVFDRLVSFAA